MSDQENAEALVNPYRELIGNEGLRSALIYDVITLLKHERAETVARVRAKWAEEEKKLADLTGRPDWDRGYEQGFKVILELLDCPAEV